MKEEIEKINLGDLISIFEKNQENAGFSQNNIKKKNNLDLMREQLLSKDYLELFYYLDKEFKTIKLKMNKKKKSAVVNKNTMFFTTISLLVFPILIGFLSQYWVGAIIAFIVLSIFKTIILIISHENSEERLEEEVFAQEIERVKENLEKKWPSINIDEIIVPLLLLQNIKFSDKENISWAIEHLLETTNWSFAQGNSSEDKLFYMLKQHNNFFTSTEYEKKEEEDRKAQLYNVLKYDQTNLKDIKNEL